VGHNQPQHIFRTAPGALQGSLWPGLKCTDWRLQPERRDYLPGERAEVAARFSSRIDYGGSVEQGPYVAWLLGGDSYGIIDPPRIPDGAIRLGVLQLKQPAPHSKWLDASARLSFTVPNLPSGDYGIGICNEPCTQSGVGDLNGGRIRIVHTPLEGHLMGRVEGLEAEARKARYQLRKSERRLEGVQSTLQTSTREHQAMTGRVSQLETQLGQPEQGRRRSLGLFFLGGQ
jgi:hypothetical protein